ncbi:MAG: YjbH domain-containing protein [Alphaproteobacteria bacterium]|nr:YjbH domain-containing protein [Alphaproteobacteria bacterium]
MPKKWGGFWVLIGTLIGWGISGGINGGVGGGISTGINGGGGLVAHQAFAAEGAFSRSAPVPYTLSPILIQSPSARMEGEGSLVVQYDYGKTAETALIGAQLTPSFFLGLRQTARRYGDDHLFPGIDWKYLVWSESRTRPAVAVGAKSFLGARAVAGEYVALSKHWKNWDGSVGLGWGRFGASDNTSDGAGGSGDLWPTLGARHKIDENPSTPQDWFHGEPAMFWSVSYTPPILPGVGFHAAYAPEYKGEAADQNAQIDASGPWNLGVSYQPQTNSFSWVRVGAYWQGDQDYLARVAVVWSPDFHRGVMDPPHAHNNEREYQPPQRSAGQGRVVPFDLSTFLGLSPGISAQRLAQHKYGLSHIELLPQAIFAELELNADQFVPTQIKQAAQYLRQLSMGSKAAIIIQLTHHGVRGREVTLRGADFDSTLPRVGGPFVISDEELWSHATWRRGGATAAQDFLKYYQFELDWRNDVSLSEDDNGVLYRTALIPRIKYFRRQNSESVTALRINLADNLAHYRDYRYDNPDYDYALPVRSDIDLFAQQRLILERQYRTVFADWGHDVYAAYTLGYLEEMYAGVSGEMLYRPFGKKYALGLELDQVFKREPQSLGALALNGDHVLSGFLNGYYEWDDDKTLTLSVGRYLAEDVGAEVGFSRQWGNGARITAYLNATDAGGDRGAQAAYDRDLYGAKMNMNGGIELSLPLDFALTNPVRARVVNRIGPMGRERGQRLDHPAPLYDMTEPLSARALR